MDRKKFLSIVGLGSASVFTVLCLAGCAKQNADNGAATAPANVDFTLDISLPANLALANPGGYLYSNGIIVAHTISGGYIAVSQACTHEGVTVQYVAQNHEFYCPSHGAIFSESGAVGRGPANSALKQYNTSLAGTILRVFS